MTKGISSGVQQRLRTKSTICRGSWGHSMTIYKVVTQVATVASIRMMCRRVTICGVEGLGNQQRLRAMLKVVLHGVLLPDRHGALSRIEARTRNVQTTTYKKRENKENCPPQNTNEQKHVLPSDTTRHNYYTSHGL